MVEKRRIWAIICGAIRLEFEFYNILSLLCEWRAQGRIEGIVLSTWKGEVDKISGLKRKLEYLNIYLLESVPLDNSEEKYTNLNYVRQAIQLNTALNYIPPDTFVIKCRTDLCIGHLNQISYFFDKCMDTNKFGNFESPIKYKIAVMTISVTLPFFINDMVFFGYAQDIRHMLVFENTYFGVGKVRNPEYCFFQSIFGYSYPIINDYTRVVDDHALRNMFRDRLHVFSEADFYLPGILNKFYALYFVLLYCCFETGIRGKITSRTFYTVFNKNKGFGSHVALDHPCTLENIVYGKFEHTIGFQKLLHEIYRIGMNQGYAKTMTFTEEDYLNTLNWGKRLGVSEKRWLKWEKINSIQSNTIGFQDASNILFSNYELNDEITAAIEEVVVGKTDYYRRLASKLNIFKKWNKKLYEKALFTAARGKDGEILGELGRQLLKGEISSEKIDEATMVFKRYVNDPLFYRSISEEQLKGLYYYGSYMAKRQNYDPARDIWKNLSLQWEMNIAEKPENFLDGICGLARKKLEIIYMEFYTNSLVGVLTNFLLEVCNDCPFSKEYLEFLKKHNEKNLLIRIYEKGWCHLIVE